MNRILTISVLLFTAACSNKPEAALAEPTRSIKCSSDDVQRSGRCKISLVALVADAEGWDGSYVEVAGFASSQGDALYLDRDSMEYGILQNGVGLVGLRKNTSIPTPFLPVIGVFHRNEYYGVGSLDNGPDSRFRGWIEVDLGTRKFSHDPYVCVNGTGGPPKGTLRNLLGENLCTDLPDMPPKPPPNA